jgi:hypothetical protein
MKRLGLVGWITLGMACATATSAGVPGDAVKPLPRATGPVTVRGGETLRLQGAAVKVDLVTFLDEPCPAGAQCIHSGIIKRVQVTVTQGDATASGGVAEGTGQVLAGVEVRVVSMAPGPVAVLEASLPVAAK